jgi:hypothetical protein
MRWKRNCARCGRKVKAADNYMKAHLWANTAVFHWTCFGALLREHESDAEQATWRGRRVAPADVDHEVEVGK